MSRPPVPLPDSLGDAFTVAAACAAGVTPRRLARLHAPYRGVRCRRPPATLAEQARAAVLALPPGAALAGRTAAMLHGLWVPGGWCPGDTVEAVVAPGVDEPHVRGIRCGSADALVVDVAGLPVCSVPDVVAQLAPRLGLVDLVVLVDSVVRRGSGWTLADLGGAVEGGRRGVRRLRRALVLAREGSASPQETIARLWLLDAGLPEPELNAPVVVDGRVLYLDLAWPGRMVALEYHGAYHFETAEQRLDDFQRLATLRRAGWTVVEVARGTLTDRRRRDAMIDEVAAALGEAPLPPHARGRTLSDPWARRDGRR